jgi:hypothetical protein
MIDTLAVIPNTDNSLALSSEFLSSLKTREDHENAFTMVTEKKNQCLWYEADIILNYYKKFLGQELDVYRAGQLMNSSTIKYYLRTASGFSPEFRIPSISFNHHYQASLSDQWDSKTLEFKGDKRYTYTAKAADEQLSTRKLQAVIAEDQEKLAKNITEFPCQFCQKKLIEQIETFTIYKNGPTRTTPVIIHAHELCMETVLDTTSY